MAEKAVLVLEDGTVYEGYSFGAEVPAHGEVVFNTSMTGYQEVLTDPSYAGQIVVLTYPLIGNYGINSEDNESKRIQVAAFVVREECDLPSHWQSTSTLGDFLKKNNITGIYGIDTRALTRRLRSAGVMMGTITRAVLIEEAVDRLKNLPRYDDTDFVRGVSTPAPYEWERNGPASRQENHVVVLDCGLKYNILRLLRQLGCKVTAVPCCLSPSEILALKPDGILLSPGPGDPALLGYLADTVKTLVECRPVMGICLGHQLIGKAYGGKTFKLKFGHRGANHPVRDLKTGRVFITAQNHGYAVDPKSIGNGLEVSHVNLNDETVEGFRHSELPVFSIQYHSEASPGPRDNVYLFNEFVEMMVQSRSKF